MQVIDQYPGDAAGGCDYISKDSRGMILERRPDGDRQRPERVLVTDVYLDFEGRICIGERTARHMAHLFGMVDGWRVAQLVAETNAIADERDLLSRELADARRQVENLLEMQTEARPTAFVALDGAEHASHAAALDASRHLAKLPRDVIAVLAPVGADEIDTMEAR